MQTKNLLLLSLLFFAATLIVYACGDDDDDDDEQVDCRTPLTIFYEECGYTVSFDDVEPASFGDALHSCAALGKMWNWFIHCYRVGYKEQDNSCEGWAACLPEHGFLTEGDDDTTDDDITDDDTSDDDTVDDDTVDDDTADDDTTDDDTADDDTTDDDTTDDDTTDDDTTA